MTAKPKEGVEWHVFEERDHSGLSIGPLYNCQGLMDGQVDAAVRIRGDKHSGVNDRQRATARRIAACWNACDGIPTDFIEQKGVNSMGEIHNAKCHIATLERDLAAMTVERDAMRDALEEIVHASELEDGVRESSMRVALNIAGTLLAKAGK